MTYTHHTYALVYIYIYTTTNLMLQNDQKIVVQEILNLKLIKICMYCKY